MLYLVKLLWIRELHKEWWTN